MAIKDPVHAKLKALGAETVGGDVLLNRKRVAMLRHGQFMLMPEGEEALKAAEAAKAAVKGKGGRKLDAPEMTDPVVGSEEPEGAP